MVRRWRKMQEQDRFKDKMGPRDYTCGSHCPLHGEKVSPLPSLFTAFLRRRLPAPPLADGLFCGKSISAALDVWASSPMPQPRYKPLGTGAQFSSVCSSSIALENGEISYIITVTGSLPSKIFTYLFGDTGS